MNLTGLPDGVSASAEGGIAGTPLTAGAYTVIANVRDANAASASRSFTVSIAPPALVFNTGTAPNATVGSAYSMTFAATGGTPPVTYSLIGSLAGLALNGGALAGRPAAPGSFSFTVTVRDAANAAVSRTFQVTFALPSTPPLNYSGLPGATNPGTQQRLQVALAQSYPVDVVVTLTMTFAPDSGSGDPAVQFASGGRTRAS